jgi:hypothetical protein
VAEDRDPHLTRAVAQLRDELAGVRTALERIVWILLILVVGSAIFALLFLGQAGKVTAPFG